MSPIKATLSVEAVQLLLEAVQSDSEITYQPREDFLGGSRPPRVLVTKTKTPYDEHAIEQLLNAYLVEERSKIQCRVTVQGKSAAEDLTTFPLSTATYSREIQRSTATLIKRHEAETATRLQATRAKLAENGFAPDNGGGAIDKTLADVPKYSVQELIKDLIALHVTAASFKLNDSAAEIAAQANQFLETFRADHLSHIEASTPRAIALFAGAFTYQTIKSELQAAHEAPSSSPDEKHLTDKLRHSFLNRRWVAVGVLTLGAVAVIVALWNQILDLMKKLNE